MTYFLCLDRVSILFTKSINPKSVSSTGSHFIYGFRQINMADKYAGKTINATWRLNVTFP